MLAEIEDFDEWLTKKLPQILQESRVGIHMYINLNIYLINSVITLPF